MEAFSNLMASYIAQEAAEKNLSDKIAEDSLKEGLSLTYDILREIDAKFTLKGRGHESLRNLLDSLYSYKCCSMEKGMKNVSYVTAELGSIILLKLLVSHKMHEKTSLAQDLSIEDAIVCPCNLVSYKDHLEELIHVLLELKSVNRIQVSCFVSSVIDMELPVVVLDALQKADLVPVSIYITQRKEDVKKSKETNQKFCEVSIRLLASLLHFGFGEDIVEPGPATSLLCHQSCNEFLDQFVIEVTNHMISEENSSSFGQHFLQLREDKWHVRETALQEYFLRILRSAATSPCISAAQALAFQHRWFYSEVGPCFSVNLNYLLTALGEEEANSGITSMIKEESAKWQSILQFITAYLSHFSGAAAALKAYVDDCLVRALTKQSYSLLACAFLVARQACLNSAIPSVRNAFPSYGVWFASAFGTEAGSVQTSTNAATFSFLMEFLTELVPTEPPFCLRVHINKVPSAPVHCSHLLTDYVSLAKTRLKDLGEATGSGLFAFEYTPKEDVAAALLNFEKSGQISRVLLDCSKFRRTQFEQQFLPALLVPEPVGEEISTRQRLITKLQILGKIPSTLLQKYEKACHDISSKHSGQRKLPISGSPLERWQAILELLVSTMRNNGVDEKGTLTDDGKTVLSALGAQLEPLLYWIAEQSDPGSLQRKVVGRLLKACEFCFEPPKPPGLKKTSNWLYHLVTHLKAHPGLLRQLHGAVYRLACDITRMPHVTEAAAALAYVLDFHKDNISIIKPPVSLDSEKLGETVGRSLQPICRKSMVHGLVFSSSYLRLVDEACAETLPLPKCLPSLLRIFIYLRERLLHSSDEEVLEICAHTWTPSSSWTVPILECQPSLTEWLDLEAEIDRTEDPVKIRHLYLCEWITQHCNQCPAPELLVASLEYITKENAAWGSEVLQIIPSIISSSNTVPPNSAVPWLLETWRNIILRFSHQNIIRCLQNLPPWLLLTNTLSVTPTRASVDALSEFLDKSMDKMSEKGFLSHNIVCMVIAAIRSSSPHCKGEMLSQFIDTCPALHLSILRHWQKLWLQLVPSFTTSCPKGCSLDRIMKVVVTDNANMKYGKTNYNWEVGLVHWSRGGPLPQVDDGSLFFYMVDLGMQLLTGSVGMLMVTEGPVLPSAMTMANLLVQEPLHCLKMVGDASKAESLCSPAAGISYTARVGLSLATMGVMLSMDIEYLPSPGSDSAKVCSKILKQCVEWWKLVCHELDLCDSRIQEVSFVQWLTKRIYKLLECFSV
ncbi:Uncharacterized protein GBIM_19610 [Gryllus bimaculatus]|nr:Uncharacterized protein GBIM_19610 [Gryllus bimaculatus]